MECLGETDGGTVNWPLELASGRKRDGCGRRPISLGNRKIIDGRLLFSTTMATIPLAEMFDFLEKSPLDNGFMAEENWENLFPALEDIAETPAEPPAAEPPAAQPASQLASWLALVVAVCQVASRRVVGKLGSCESYTNKDNRALLPC